MVFTLLEQGRSTKAYLIEEWLRNSIQVPSSQSLLGSRVPRLFSQAFPFGVNVGSNMSAAVTELGINNIWLDLFLFGFLKFQTDNNGKGILTRLVTNGRLRAPAYQK